MAWGTDRARKRPALPRRLVPILTVARDAALSFDRRHGTQLAAQLGFYSLVAFPPLLLIAVWILSQVFGSEHLQTELVEQIVNGLPLEEVEGHREIASLLKELTRGAGGLGLISILILLYSGSGAIGAVRQAVESSQGPGAPGRRFPKSKLFDLMVTAITVPVLLVVVGLSLSKGVASLLDSAPVLDLLARLSGGGATVFVTNALLLTWLYWIQNPGERTWPSALLGGFVAAGLCYLVWVCLGVWFGITGGGSAVYGVLAGFIGLLLFLNLACLAVVFGAHLAASFRRFRARDRAVG